jgi:GNAT superfamily N-acetyltransferase
MLITTEPARIDVDAALALLRSTYWAQTMSRELLERAMTHSLCFGALDGDALVGFARVVSDRATYAYLTDFVVAERVRGGGIGRQMIEAMIVHQDLQGLRRFALLTRDAMALYEKCGFERGSGALTYMERR